VQVLESSKDLKIWGETAVFHDGPFDFADVTATTNGTRYFRVSSRPRTAADDGRNQLSVPEDPFVVPVYTSLGFPGLNWVKFAILLGDETRVWFQDSVKYPFHYDFAKARLAPFKGMNRDEFDLRTLHRPNQVAVLGAVLIPGNKVGSEFGIQFAGQEPFPRDDVLRWLKLVKAAVRAPAGATAFYVPTFEQESVARQDAEGYASAGFAVVSSDRWLSQDAVYSEGWALGRLTFVAATNLSTAYASGQLGPGDILLTDAVPAEVPYVAGIISLTPATPNSHVAILAKSYGVPFVWLADPAVRTNLLSMADREIALRTGQGTFAGITILDVEGQLPPEIRKDLLALKRTEPLKYTPKEVLGTIATNVNELRPDASRFVGGKAANYGLLRRTIPGNSEPAIALTFDLWDAFLAQMLPNGHTLQAEIDLQVGGLTYPPDFASVRLRLSALQTIFTKTAKFTPAQQAAIIGALTNAGFDGSKNIRFRSSTNVEDSEDFTGAGLYDSYSGCLADELDGNTSGPSICDPTESNERGIFRAIQKVYASFYNENAFLERLRRGVNEEEVGMAVLVHHSFPDDIELANGVATLNWSKSFGSVSMEGRLVTQPGASSVTNPDSTARPEVVNYHRFGASTSLFLEQESSLLPRGSHVLPWEGDYQSLVGLLTTVANGYSAMFPNKTSFGLDFEYKRIVPGKLDIKQVRPLPAAPAAKPITAWLLPETVTLVVEEGEYSDVFAIHRLKCELQLATDARRLNAAGLSTSFYTNARFATRIGTNSYLLTNGLTAWPDRTYKVNGAETTDGWSLGNGTERRVFKMQSSSIVSTTPPQAPWVTQRDFPRYLSVDYASPQPSLGFDGPTTTQSDFVRLVVATAIGPDSLPQTRSVTNHLGMAMAAHFYWPPPPKGITAGYTAWNIGFVDTTLRGLTTSPLVLHARAAQTYHPFHHNFSEMFLFEPRLDPGVTPEQLAELDAHQIVQIVFGLGFDGVKSWAVDAAGKIREL
jgi:hypothetical protein